MLNVYQILLPAASFVAICASSPPFRIAKKKYCFAIVVKFAIVSKPLNNIIYAMMILKYHIALNIFDTSYLWICEQQSQAL